MDPRQHFAAILESSEDAILSTTLEGVVTYWNRGAERLYGYAAQEAVGQPISFLVPPDGADEAARMLERVARGERIAHHRTKRRRKDGTLVDVSLSVAPLRDDGGRIVGMAKIARDRATRMRERAELARSQERLAVTQRVAEVGDWEWDFATGEVTWSDEMFRLLGRDPRADRPAADLEGIVHPADVARVRTEVDSALAERRGFVTEFRIERPDGSVRVLHVRAEIALDADLRPRRLDGTAQDITERRAIEDELRRRQEKLDLVARATDDLVWDWDIRTDRTTRNRGLAAYGYEASDAQPTRDWWRSLVHPDDLEGLMSSVREALDSGATSWSRQYRLRRKDGAYATVLDRGYVSRDPDGRPVRMVGAMVDVSERERAQELARRSAASAELLARASHELRTPLNAILGFSDLLEQRLQLSLGDRERRYLRNIRDSGLQLLGLVDRLLQIAKADTGRLDLQRAVVTVRGLVEPALDGAVERAAAAGIALEVAPYPQAAVRVDPERIGTVLRELLANALRLTPVGGRVRVTAATADEDLVLEVADGGPGIPEEARDRIFGVFERVRDDTSAGTGLGLALCRELVELHGGTIVFESEPGMGTTFRVRIPRVVWAGGGDERILIVEDEPNDADLVVTVARDAGLRCEVVGSVAEARAAIERRLPLAVVLDLRLRDGNGSAVVETLRAHDARVPIAVVTAYEDEPQPPGTSVRMPKPLDPAALAAWLRESVAAGVSA